MYHTRLYISWQIQKFSVFFSSTFPYVFWSFCLKKAKTCNATQFCKISFIVFIFDPFFLQDMQWVLMSYSVFSARFLVGFGGFLLWFLRKVFLCVCKLHCKIFLSAFGLKNYKCCLRRWQWKRKEVLRLLLGHKTNFGYRLLIYFRQSSFLKGLF